MSPHGLRRYTACALAAAALAAPALAACQAQSGAKTAALVELYTSEGCSSCPPAERQFNSLRGAVGAAAELVPLALHVDYWDYIGWKDPYAKRAFADRQGWLVRANQRKTVYTPQFFVGGAEPLSRLDELRARVERINAQPALASIRVQAKPNAGGALALSAEASVAPSTPDAALYLALSESGLVSKVTRGENSGATLVHDHVVRAWIGPIRLAGGSIRLRRDIELAPDWQRAHLDLSLFVQDQRSGRVLQALSAPHCADS